MLHRMAKKLVSVLVRMPDRKMRMYNSGPLEDEEAQKLLEEEVLPKVGKSQGVRLRSDLVLNGRDIISAELSKGRGQSRGLR